MGAMEEGSADRVPQQTGVASGRTIGSEQGGNRGE